MAQSELIPADTARSLTSILENLEAHIDKLPTPDKARSAVTDMLN